MRRARTLATVALGSAVLLPFVGAGTAMAADGDVMANLKPSRSTASTRAAPPWSRSAAPRSPSPWRRTACSRTAPHAAHIHFAAAARHECPTAADDTNGDGHAQHHRGRPRLRRHRRLADEDRRHQPRSRASPSTASTRAQGGKISYQRGSIQVSSDVAKAIGKRPVRRRHPRRRLQQGRQVLRQHQERPRPEPPHRGDRPGPVRRAHGSTRRRRGHRRRRRLEPDQHRSDRPRRWPAARGRRLGHPDGASRPRPELMDQPAQHGGRRGVVLAAVATVVLVLLAGALLTLGLRSSGPPQPPAADAAPQSPAPQPRRRRRRRRHAATGGLAAVGPVRGPATGRRTPALAPARPVDLGPILPGSPPTRLDIPSIGVHTSTFVGLGRGRDGSLEVPRTSPPPASTPSGRPRASSDQL